MTPGEESVDVSMYKIIEKYAQDVISVIDMKGVFQYASPAHGNYLGFIPAHVSEIFKFVFHEDITALRETFRQAILNKEPQMLEFRCRFTTRSLTWLEMVITPVLDISNEVYLIIMNTRNITERKFYEERLKNMAFHDPLTNLPNRRLFSEHFHHALAVAKRNQEKLAVLYIDWNDFKGINDSMGHDIGDLFLKEFADRISSCLREVDTFARLGGDEFIILLPCILNKDNVEKVVKRIYNVVKRPWQVKGHSLQIAIAIGISIFPEDGEDGKSLLKHADIALYESKEKGYNQYQFYNEK